jgi:hypothetical protein
MREVDYIFRMLAEALERRGLPVLWNKSIRRLTADHATIDFCSNTTYERYSQGRGISDEWVDHHALDTMTEKQLDFLRYRLTRTQ